MEQNSFGRAYFHLYLENSITGLPGFKRPETLIQTLIKLVELHFLTIQLPVKNNRSAVLFKPPVTLPADHVHRVTLWDGLALAAFE